jgi:hypothetical protein
MHQAVPHIATPLTRVSLAPVLDNTIKFGKRAAYT